MSLFVSSFLTAPPGYRAALRTTGPGIRNINQYRHRAPTLPARASEATHYLDYYLPHRQPPSPPTVAFCTDGYLPHRLLLSVSAQTNQRKLQSKWTTSYSDVTLIDAEQRLGFRFQTMKVASVKNMLTEANYALEGDDLVLKTKEKVYDEIVQYLTIEGYPVEADSYFTQFNISDLIYAIISPILCHFIRKTGRKSLQLLREKEIVSTDFETDGMEEFVVMDLITVRKRNYVLVILGAKGVFLGDATKHFLLTMKDMRDNNSGGEVYTFITIGEYWRMIRYNGTSFVSTEKFTVLFDTMETEK
ncbi:hypothetical protein RUND412_006303 [Rhizina undulata]